MFSSLYFCVGEILAKDLDCSFTEVSASEQVSQVAEVFHEVSPLHDVIGTRATFRKEMQCYKLLEYVNEGNKF